MEFDVLKDLIINSVIDKQEILENITNDEIYLDFQNNFIDIFLIEDIYKVLRNIIFIDYI